MRGLKWILLAIVLALLPGIAVAQSATPSSATPSPGSIAAQQLEAIVPTAASIFGDDWHGVADYAPDVKLWHAIWAHGWYGGSGGESLFIEGLVSNPSHDAINKSFAFLSSEYQTDALGLAERSHGESNASELPCIDVKQTYGIDPVTHIWVATVFCSFTPSIMVRITISGGVALRLNQLGAEANRILRILKQRLVDYS